MDFATIQVNGRMVSDPKTIPAGESTKVVFSVAVNRNFRRNNEWTRKTTFIDCVAWGNAGKHVTEHGKKGCKVALTGDWETDRFMGKDNTEVVRHQINIDNVSVFSAKDEVPATDGTATY